MISKKIIALFLFFLTTLASFSQDTNSGELPKQKFTISGTITDASSNETLIGVNISIPELKTGVTTNEYGFYSITLPKGNYKIQITYLGYQTIEELVNLNQNTKNNFRLIGKETLLQEVLIIDNSNKAAIRKTGNECE